MSQKEKLRGRRKLKLDNYIQSGVSERETDENPNQKMQANLVTRKRTRSRSDSKAIATISQGNSKSPVRVPKRGKISDSSPKGDLRQIIRKSVKDNQSLCPQNQQSHDEFDIIEVAVDAAQDDEFMTDEEDLNSQEDGEIVDMEDNVDKSDFGDEGPGCSYNTAERDDSYMTEKVDSEVNFRVKRLTNQSCMDNLETSLGEGDYNNEVLPLQDFEDPWIESYIQRVIDRQWKEKEKQLNEMAEKQMGNALAMLNRPNNSQVKNVEEPMSRQNQEPNQMISKTFNQIKSPSDTTIYTPGLKRTPDRNKPLHSGKDVIDQISDFVDNIRMNQRLEERKTPRQSTLKRSNIEGDGGSSKEVDDARSAADKQIIEAERFKAALTPQKQGNENYFLNTVRTEGQGVFVGIQNKLGGLMEDDEFFHITCHVDPVLRAKIERGEFVELEKILPKEKFRSKSDEGHLEFFNRDGHTYLAPANREVKISNVHKWEQAFRVYAAIYSKANPARAAEIWQYVYVINTAAAAYIWENVSFYDYTFRQMMSVNPQRSWSKIFNQVWNLAMHEPISTQKGQQTYQGYGGQLNRFSGGSNFGKKKRKSDACWKYNPNESCGPNCNFEHKCSYCRQYSHSVLD